VQLATKVLKNCYTSLLIMSQMKNFEDLAARTFNKVANQNIPALCAGWAKLAGLGQEELFCTQLQARMSEFLAAIIKENAKTCATIEAKLEGSF
jgi:hypothetical protein